MAQEMVKVNVYSPTGGQHVAYHTGLEVFGTEYVFGGGGNTGATGVTIQRPRAPPPGSGWTFYQTCDIAPLTVSKDEVTKIVQELKVEFSSGSYDLVARNCNHFSDALSNRLCGKGIPSWVNALAGIGNSLGVGDLIKKAMGQTGGYGGAGGKADVGAGGLASTGMMAGSVGADGDLSGEIDWPQCGILNAQGDAAIESLRAGTPVSSEEDSTAEMLFQLPLKSQVKLQAMWLSCSSSEQAPTHVRLFANERNLDMDDAAGGVAPTADFAKIPWENGADGSVTAKLEVNFLKFQNLGFIAVHLCREDDDGLPEEGGQPISVQAVRFVGKT